MRTVVITGGGSGMGRATAHRFASAGDTVYILGRRKEKLEETAKGFTNIRPITCDATDTESVNTAVGAIVAEQGTIDVLVNNVGGNLKNKPENPTPEQELAMWREVMMTNLDSAFIVTSACLPHITDGEGRIIFIGSSAGITGSSQIGVSGMAYAAAKAGLVGLMRTLVKDLGRRQITANLVLPGPVDNTDFFPGGHLPDRIASSYKDRTPLPEFATVENVAAAVFFLASKEAGATTGEMLNVSSGMLYSR